MVLKYFHKGGRKMTDTFNHVAMMDSVMMMLMHMCVSFVSK